MADLDDLFEGERLEVCQPVTADNSIEVSVHEALGNIPTGSTEDGDFESEPEDCESEIPKASMARYQVTAEAFTRSLE